MEEKSKITDKITDKRLKNLKPAWKKGDPSPNPKGHPKGQPNYATMRERAIRLLAEQNGKTPLEIEDEINANALFEARKGNFQFYKDDKDRTYGQAKQVTEISGNIKVEKLEAIQDATKRILSGEE